MYHAGELHGLMHGPHGLYNHSETMQTMQEYRDRYFDRILGSDQWGIGSCGFRWVPMHSELCLS